jgi:hypothetical protein
LDCATTINLGYELIPNDDLLYTNIPGNNINSLDIPNDDLLYGNIPGNNINALDIPIDDLIYGNIPVNNLGSLDIPIDNLIYNDIFGFTPTPTPTPTITPTIGLTPTPTPTGTLTPTPTPTPGGFNKGPFTFDFDYMLCEYYFTDGTDMDTVSYMTVPSIMESTSSDPNAIGPVSGSGKYYNYVGTCAVSDSGPQFPLSPTTPFLTYGGDNRSANGTESVLFNLLEFKIQHSGVTNIQFAFTADWYGSVGNNPVTMKATLWKGGAPIYFDDPDYTWTNPTATGTYSVNSSGQVITLNVQDCEPYELVSNLQYNLTTYQGQFI